ncbi:hypothetical protein ACFL6L_04450 [candidate division KSB1 bacterium]
MNKVITKCLMLVMIVGACTYNPTDIGENEIIFRDFANSVVVTSVDLDSTSVVRYAHTAPGLAYYTHLGEHNGHKCSVLLKFIDFPTSAQIESAVLFLAPVAVTDSLAQPFTAEVYRVESGWAENDQDNSSIEKGVLLGMFTVNPSASVTDSVIIPLNVVTDWTANTANNFGIMLTSQNAGFAKHYYTRHTENKSFLKVDYVEADTVSTDYVLPYSDSYIIEGTNLFQQGLAVSNHGPHRMLLRFDIDAIPEEAAVNYAELVLTIDDNLSSIGFDDTYGFRAVRINTESWMPDLWTYDDDFSAVGDLDNNELRFDVTNIFRNWASRQASADGTLVYPNYGIAVFSLSERNDLSEFIFRQGGNSPRIELLYTEFTPIKQD